MNIEKEVEKIEKELEKKALELCEIEIQEMIANKLKSFAEKTGKVPKYIYVNINTSKILLGEKTVNIEL